MEFTFSLGDGQEPQPLSKLPLRLLVLADFAAGDSHEGADFFALQTAADLDAFIARLSPHLYFTVPDRLTGGTASFEVDVKIQSIKDLGPEQLIASQPRLAKAAALIDALRDAKQQDEGALGRLAEQAVAYPALAAAIGRCDQPRAADEGEARAAKSPPVAAAPEPTGDVGRLLDMVDVPGQQSKERVRSTIGGLVSQIASSEKKKRKGERSVVDRAIGDVEALFSEQIDLVLHHPDFQRAEAAFRGLKLLVDRAQLRNGPRVEVKHLTRARLLGALETGAVSALMEQDPLPPSLLVAPYLFDDVTQAASLTALASLGEAHQIPVVTSVDAGFFGLEQGAGAALPYTGSVLEQPEYAKWSSLKSKDSARWLAVAFNRLLLRGDYDKPRLGYRERPRADLDRLWGDACWAVAALVARSYARYGWATQIIGPQDGKLPDLPVRSVLRNSGREVELPVEARLTSQQAEDLIKSGFVVLLGSDNSDALHLVKAPMVYGGDGASRVSLAYQLLASRVVQSLGLLRSTLTGAEPQELGKALERFLRELVADTGVGAFAEVSVGQAGEEAQVTVSLRTGRAVLRGAAVDLQFLF